MVIESAKEQITLYYGAQTLNGKPYNHTGIDIVKQTNSFDYIVAAEKGTVIEAGKHASYGNYVKINHSAGIHTLYAHLSNLTVRVGQVIAKGARLGYMGATGYAFGAHLHFEVRVNNSCVNPLPYLQGQKKLIEVIPASKYSVGRYKVTATAGLRIRAGAGTNYSIKTNSNFPTGVYPYGQVFDALEVKGSWGRSPSGWLCLDYAVRV